MVTGADTQAKHCQVECARPAVYSHGVLHAGLFSQEIFEVTQFGAEAQYWAI